MTLDRRFVLKSMALSGMAGLTLSRAAPGFAAPSATVSGHQAALLALSTGGGAEALFLQGIKAALGYAVPAHRPGQDLSALLTIERQLQRSEPLRLIGLLDDASATLVLDLARSSGARVQWVGEHNNIGAVTRHRLSSTDFSGACGHRLHQQLSACGASPVNEATAPGALTGKHVSTFTHPTAGGAEWISSLGFLLASLGRDQMKVAPTPSSNASPEGSFVSFLIET